MEQADLAIIEEKPRRKRRSRGFGIEVEGQSPDVQNEVEELVETEEQVEETEVVEPVEAPAVLASPAPKRHVPLVRPMTPKKPVPQRGTKGASRVRP